MPVHDQSRLPADAARETQQHEITTRCREFGQQMMDEHPLAATLSVFGVGLGVGTIIGGLLAERRTSRAGRAEALGRRVLDAVRDALPDGVRSYLG